MTVELDLELKNIKEIDMAGGIYDDFDYTIVTCNCCGVDFPEEEIEYEYGTSCCPECGEPL